MEHFSVEGRAHFHLASPYALKSEALNWIQKRETEKRKGETTWPGPVSALREEKEGFRPEPSTFCQQNLAGFPRLPRRAQIPCTGGLDSAPPSLSPLLPTRIAHKCSLWDSAQHHPLPAQAPSIILQPDPASKQLHYFTVTKTTPGLCRSQRSPGNFKMRKWHCHFCLLHWNFIETYLPWASESLRWPNTPQWAPVQRQDQSSQGWAQWEPGEAGGTHSQKGTHIQASPQGDAGAEKKFETAHLPQRDG